MAKKQKEKLFEEVQFQDVERAKREVTLAKINQIRILALLLTLAFTLSLTACRKSDTSSDNSSVSSVLSQTDPSETEISTVQSSESVTESETESETESKSENNSSNTSSDKKAVSSKTTTQTHNSSSQPQSTNQAQNSSSQPQSTSQGQSSSSQSQPTQPAKLNPKTDFKIGRYRAIILDDNNQICYRIDMDFQKGEQYNGYVTYYVDRFFTKELCQQNGLTTNENTSKVVLNGITYYGFEEIYDMINGIFEMTDTLVKVDNQEGKLDNLSLNADGTLVLETNGGVINAKIGTIFTFVQ